MNIDISSAVESAALKAVKQADLNRIVQKFTQEFQKEIDAEYERILEEAIVPGSGWLWKHLSWALSQGVQEAVYDAYESNSTHPQRYVRRGVRIGSGGIGDPNNFRFNIIDGEIWVENLALPRDDSGKLEDIILSGKGYHYQVARGSKGTFRKPRNFYASSHQYYDEAYVQSELNTRLNKRAQIIADDVMRRV